MVYPWNPLLLHRGRHDVFPGLLHCLVPVSLSYHPGCGHGKGEDGWPGKCSTQTRPCIRYTWLLTCTHTWQEVTVEWINLHPPTNLVPQAASRPIFFPPPSVSLSLFWSSPAVPRRVARLGVRQVSNLDHAPEGR